MHIENAVQEGAVPAWLSLPGTLAWNWSIPQYPRSAQDASDHLPKKEIFALDIQ